MNHQSFQSAISNNAIAPVSACVCTLAPCWRGGGGWVGGVCVCVWMKKRVCEHVCGSVRVCVDRGPVFLPVYAVLGLIAECCLIEVVFSESRTGDEDSRRHTHTHSQSADEEQMLLSALPCQAHGSRTHSQQHRHLQ